MSVIVSLLSSGSLLGDIQSDAKGEKKRIGKRPTPAEKVRNSSCDVSLPSAGIAGSADAFNRQKTVKNAFASSAYKVISTSDGLLFDMMT